MNNAPPDLPPSPPASAESDLADPSVAGEEDPGAGEDDPELRDALRGEAAVVRTNRGPAPPP